MNVKKQQSMILGIAVASLMISVGFFTGCTSDNTNNNQSTYVLLTGTQHEILDSVNSEYATLLTNLSAEDARTELVNQLNSHYEEIASARLGDDNTTIFIDFSNGRCVAFDTFDSTKYNDSAILLENDNNASGQGSSQYDNYKLFFNGETQAPPVQDPRIHSFSPLSLSEDTDPELPWEKTTCRSKKVIMLVPCGYEDVTAHYQCEAYFKKHGWKDEDITIKANMENSSMDMRPEDFFHLDEYGIILIFAHGMIDDHSDEKKMWLECCTLDNETIRENELYRQWFDQKILIPKTGFRPVSKNDTDTVNKTNVHWYYRIIIRLDILRQNIGSLPDSFVHLATCNSIYFKDAFMTNGAKIVLSWNRAVYRFVADTNQIHIVKCMLEKNYSVYASYQDNTVIRSYTDYWTRNHLLIEFLIYPPPNESSIAESFYFPTWLDLQVSGIPSGTSFVRINMYDKDAQLLFQSEEKVSSGQTELEMTHLEDVCFPPTEEYTIDAVAFDTNNQEITTAETTTTLKVGKNTVQIAFAESGELTIVLDPENGQLDARRTNWPMLIEAIYENAPNGNLLYVWDASGAEGLGGFTSNMVQQYENYDNGISFYSSGTGTDGTKIPITLSVYLVKDGQRQLLETASATIDVYHPMTRYSLVDQDDKTGWGAGSWEFYNWGHGSVGYEFYARSGDQIRIECIYKGYYAEWEHPQVYLKQGETKTFLFNVDDISEGGSFDQTFIVP